MCDSPDTCNTVNSGLAMNILKAHLARHTHTDQLCIHTQEPCEYYAVLQRYAKFQHLSNVITKITYSSLPYTVTTK
jgi:hypothetical protein